MANIYLGRHPILNKSGKHLGYEFLYREGKGEIQRFPTNLNATARVLLNSLTHMNLDEAIGDGKFAFINIDHTILKAEFLDLLDPKYFILEILETTEVTDQFIENVIALRKKGYKFAIDDFDCSSEMINKFSKLFKLLTLVKIDIKETTPKKVAAIIPKFHQLGIKVIAEKIETKEEFKTYLDIKCDFFQGYYFGETEVIESINPNETASFTILQVVQMLNADQGTVEIENYMKTCPELSYDLLKYLNSPFIGLGQKISSINQAINLLGRDKFKKWLLIYLYAETADNKLSKSVLETVISRAENMEATGGSKKEKDKAYLTGMLSMLDTLFSVDLKAIFKKLAVDNEIRDAVIKGEGELGTTLRKVRDEERTHIKSLVTDNFDKFKLENILQLLESEKIKVHQAKIES